MRTPRRRGRPAGQSDTRAAILAAAREEFAKSGYDGATVRAIASAAGVDPALVHHYFGSKEKLFTAAVVDSEDMREVLEGVLEHGALEQPAGLTPTEASRGLVRSIVTLWDSPAGAAGMALLRSAVNSEMAARLMREMLTARIIRHAVASFGIPEQEMPARTALLASQMSGLVLTRFVLKIEPLASASVDQLVDAVAPTVERYLFGDLEAMGFGEG